MKLNWKVLGIVTVIVAAALLIFSAGSGAASPPEQGGVTASKPVSPGISPAVRDLPVSRAEPVLLREINPRHNPHLFDGDMGKTGSDTTGVDPLVQTGRAPGVSPAPTLTFEGLGVQSAIPPDTIGEVGPNHYVQMVNIQFAIYDKTGTLLKGPLNINQLWTGQGGNCEANNDGDPVVLYDSLADRWLLSQFASPNHMCVAISQTPDPTGAFYLYEFDVGTFPDYFKFGVWPDAYYMSANESSYTAYAFDRAKMLTGQAATFQKFSGQTNFLLPADLDGPVSPPANAPGYFYTFKDDSFHGGADRLEVFEFHVDWATPANSSFTLADTIAISPFNYTVCTFFNLDCIPQKNTTQKVDAISEWPMWRLQYRNFGAHQTLVGNFTVDVNGSDLAGIRWFELRKSGGGWTLYQEGTHSPDSAHRWLGSIAMDGSGNIALGYSHSSTADFPSIRYAVRQSSDPLGALQAEAVLQAGGGSQTGANRWGDYSSLNVDPADDCSFWYTNEYYTVSSGGSWHTRVGVFEVPGCTGSTFADFLLTAAPDDLTVCTPNSADYTVSAEAIGGFSDPTTLSAGGAPGSVSFSANPVTPADPPATSTMTVGTTGVSAGTYPIVITGLAPTSTHTATVTLNVFDASPSGVTLNMPANGATGISFSPTFGWSGGTGAESYLLEVAADSGFGSIVYTATVVGQSHTIATALAADTTYYWRVTPNNACGAGTLSTAFSFTTQGSSLACGDTESFESGIPTDWTKVAVSGPQWGTTNDGVCGSGIVGSGNFAGTGVGACIDSDAYGSSGLVDSYLCSPALNLSHSAAVTASFLLNYQIYSTSDSNDLFEVVAGTNSPAGPYDSPLFSATDDYPDSISYAVSNSGGLETLDLSAYAGQSKVFICFRYQANYDWYAHIDDVSLSCVQPYNATLSGNETQSGAAGSTLTYTVRISNTGQLSDTYNLTASSVWTATVDPVSVTLNSQAQTDIAVTVNIPPEAAAGDKNTTVVTATSQTTPTVSVSASLRTAVPYPMYLPLVLK